MRYEKTMAFLLAGLMLAGAATLTGCSTEKFPNRPITLIIPYGAGGDTDVTSRALSEAAAKNLGVTIMIKNVPGAEATLGVAETKNSNPDGYTLGVATLSGITMSPHIMKLSYKFDDFDYLLGFARYIYAIGVPAKSPTKTLDDFIKWAKGSKEPLKYSCMGMPGQIVMYQVGKPNNLKFAHVPYSTQPEGNLAMLNGHVDFVVSTSFAAAPLLKTGEIRLLATCADRWTRLAPDVPTLKELGYNVDVYSLMALITPSQVSKEKKDTLFNAFRKAAEDQKFIEMQKRFMVESPPLEREEMKKVMVQKYDEYSKIISEMGIKKK